MISLSWIHSISRSRTVHPETPTTGKALPAHMVTLFLSASARPCTTLTRCDRRLLTNRHDALSIISSRCHYAESPAMTQSPIKIAHSPAGITLFTRWTARRSSLFVWHKCESGAQFFYRDNCLLQKDLVARYWFEKLNRYNQFIAYLALLKLC